MTWFELLLNCLSKFFLDKGLYLEIGNYRLRVVLILSHFSKLYPNVQAYERDGLMRSLNVLPISMLNGTFFVIQPKFSHLPRLGEKAF